MSWTPLDPYSNPGDGDLPLTGAALIAEVAFHKRTAAENGEAPDPDWDQWIADDQTATSILDKLRTR